MTRAEHFAWSAISALGVGVGIVTYFWMGSGNERTQPTVPDSSGSLLGIHSAPRAIPEFTFQDEKGQPRTIGNFRGKLVLLNLWATWCAPCREEMPALDRLQQRLGGAEFEVVALSIDQQGVHIARKFFDETGIKALRLYVDPSAQAAFKLGALGLPSTLVIDSTGREIGRRTGPAKWDSPEFVADLELRMKSQR
ncbi:MAG TPA: TlpA disulfide reductase family protein [Burkholderiales bacterium]|nr:TlpA disulfide reductase family protein [Burkholderiales bacterium]